jgi:hypothetical protein
MVSGADVLFDPKDSAYFLGKFSSEVGVSVGYDPGWNSVMWYHMFGIEFCCPFCGDAFVAQNKDGCFAAVVVGNCQNAVETI